MYTLGKKIKGKVVDSFTYDNKVYTINEWKPDRYRLVDKDNDIDKLAKEREQWRILNGYLIEQGVLLGNEKYANNTKYRTHKLFILVLKFHGIKK